MVKISGKKSQDEVNNKLPVLTIGDFILIIFLIFLSAGTYSEIYTNNGSTVAVYIDNRLVAEYMLENDRIFDIKVDKGNVKVCVKNRKVSVLSSTCRRQVCVKSGKISRSYQQLVCAPNHVLIEIKGKSGEKDIDAITK